MSFKLVFILVALAASVVLFSMGGRKAKTSILIAWIALAGVASVAIFADVFFAALWGDQQGAALAQDFGLRWPVTVYFACAFGLLMFLLFKYLKITDAIPLAVFVLPGLVIGAGVFMSARTSFRSDGTALKCAAYRANGVELLLISPGGTAEVDPESGLPCIPLTPQTSAAIAQLTEKAKRAEPPRQLSAETDLLFSPVSNQALAWTRTSASGEVEFWDVPFVEGQALSLVTANDVRLAKTLSQQRSQAIADLQNAQRAENQRSQLIAELAVPPGLRAETLMLLAPGAPNGALEAFGAVPQLAVVESDAYRRLTGGDWQALDTTDLYARFRQIVAVRVDSNCRSGVSGVAQSLRICEVRALVNSRTHAFSLSDTQPGVTQTQAEQEAIKVLAVQLEQRLGNI